MIIAKLCKVLCSSSISSLKFPTLNSLGKAEVCITLFKRLFCCYCEKERDLTVANSNFNVCTLTLLLRNI